MKKFLPHFESRLGTMTWTLRSLIEGETPTDAKAEVDQIGAWLASWAEEQGARIIEHNQPVVGNFIECRWNENLPAKPTIILCHLDTVHPLGTLEKRPTTIEDDVLYGVGAYDMKAGIAVVHTVMEELVREKILPKRPITVFFNTDEEIGSVYSRRTIEKIVKDAGLVLVTEFSGYEERIVTGRKGVGIFQITTLGKEAHSGSAPQDGLNAIIEMAHHINKVGALSNAEMGTTVTPAVIRGGTRHNVIPGECDLVINVRVKYRSEAERVEAALNEIADGPAIIPGVEMFLTGEYRRPPMERDDTMIKTFQTLKQVAGEQLGEEFRGGGSDGNFSAAMGIPTLDGLGPSGEGAHAANEQVYLPSMPRRAALLASLLLNWPQSPREG